MYFPVHKGWRNGELRVFRRAEGSPKSRFHERVMPKGVYTDSRCSRHSAEGQERQGAHPQGVLCGSTAPESVNRTANAARPDRRPFVSTSVAVCRAASVSAPPGIVGATETPRYTGPKASQRPAHQARASAVHTDITVTPMRFANAFQCLLTLAVMHFAFYSC